MKRSSLKKLIKTVLTETQLHESMAVHVQGANYDRTNDLDSLCSNILNTVIGPILQKLPPDQIDYFKKNGPTFWETFVPDGSYFENPKDGNGVINFYISGFTSQTLQVIIKAIFNKFRQMGVKWSKVKKDQSRMFKSQVIRIPIIFNPGKYDGPPNLNMANVNAYHVFHNVLQYEPEDESGSSFSMEAKELKERIETLLKHDYGWVKKNIIKPTDSQNPEMGGEDNPENPHNAVLDKLAQGLGGPRMVSPGMDSDTIKERLLRILEIADWAIDHGKDKITVA